MANSTPRLQHWEPIARELQRVAVPGGWLYRTIVAPYSEHLPATVALSFVPFPVSNAAADLPMGYRHKVTA